jgi:hypothetical protein
MAIAVAASAVGLQIFFSTLLLAVLGAGFYLARNRRKFFAHHGYEGDTYASANLRLWLVILI